MYKCNKLNIKLKLISTFLFALLIISFTCNQIFAKDLVTIADIVNNDAGELVAHLCFSSRANATAPFPDKGITTYYRGGGDHLQSYAIGFQGLSDNTKYEGTTDGPYWYDTDGGGQVSVKLNGNTGYGFDLSFSASYPGEFYEYSQYGEQVGSQIYNRNKWFLGASYLSKLVERYNKAPYISGEYIKIKYSLLNHTLSGGDHVMNTAAEAIDTVTANGWLSANWGAGGAGGSVINYYDNWLLLPLDKLNNRTAIIKYWLRQDDGTFDLVKTEEEKFGSGRKTITKSNIGGGDDRFYIGGKMSEGRTESQAERNLEYSARDWGWDTSSITIGPSSKETYYCINFYYDYRDVTEKHLKDNGDVINPDLNKTTKDFGYPLTRQSVTFKAIIPIYYKYEKWVHIRTNFDHRISTAKTITLNPIKGANRLVFRDTHFAYFYYEFEPPREVYVRHLVYNNTTKRYEVDSALTNQNEAVRDGEEGKYYLRRNGYNQRHYKCGEPDYVDSVKNGFNEQYIIDFGDTIKLDKSRTIENEGIKYKYQGAKVQESSVPSILGSKAQADTLNKNNTIVTLGPKRSTKTYVDFYYTKSKVPVPGGGDPTDPTNPPGGGDPTDPNIDIEPDKPGDDPSIDFVPKDDGGNELGPDSGTTTGECKVVYVPAGENLKSYITAIMYRAYSLIYDGNTIDPNTGVIKYKLIKYDAYKYVDGYVQNNATSKYGYFNSTEKKGVFNTNTDTHVNPITSVIDNELRNSINALENSNPNSINSINDGRKTKASDYGEDNTHKVNSDKYNGVRKPVGKAGYNVTRLVSNGTKTFQVIKNNIPLVDTKNDTQINVFTPASIKDVVVESVGTVNHSNQESFVIQKNSEFTIKPITGNATDYKNINDTAKYIKYYWIVGDFDMKLKNVVTVYDKSSKSTRNAGAGEIVRAGNLVQIPVGGSLSAIATNDDEAGDIVNQFSNKIKVVAVTHNTTDTPFENNIIDKINATTSLSYVDKNKISKVTTSCGEESNKQSHKKLTDLGGLQVTNMYDDSHYFVEATKTSKNIGRIYDFKITDCLDVNYKNVFRKSNNGDVNDLRGIKYFSGVRRLLVYGGNGVQLGANQNNQNNIFQERSSTDASLNSVVSKTIVPFGPYKHIDQNYIQAPKMGYRVSFDLKTSGMYTKNKNAQSSVRYIKITPTYYYISKDGKTFKENIELYYKNSSGKYVNFAGSGYTIYFKPNDGYRTTFNKDEAPELKDMSTKLEALKIGGTATDKSFILNDSMMSYSDNNFVQAWYGEFKLPNSTIVVEVGADGKKDINKPLTDGYVGVRFDIKCIDKETPSASEADATKTTIVSYGQNDKTAAGAGMAVNTTQWDYEGFIGFASSNIGKALSGGFRLQLEKDFWRIESQEMYEKVKSTVVFFDTDNRAANDFE